MGARPGVQDRVVEREPDAVVGDPVDDPGLGLSDPTEDEPGPEQVPDPPDEGTGGSGGSDGVPEDGGPFSASQVCYPGADESFGTCLPLVTDTGLGSAYHYPSSSQLAYQPPVRFVDLQAVSPSTMLAPNFALNELMQEHKGRYALFQPHVVSKLQTMRDQTGGALLIHSAFRSPGYNAGVDGATFSRHMYGDAIDMHSAVVSLSSMSSLCNALGADYVSVYTTHVHCDWRYAGNDPAFFGASAMMIGDDHSPPSRGGAWLEVGHDGAWIASADGFDEGEPYREWTAYDAHGQSLGTVAAATFRPAPEAETIEVTIGGRHALRALGDSPEEAMHLPDGLVPLRLSTLSAEP